MKETLEEDLLDTAIQVVGSNNVTTIREFLVKHKWQQERMYSEEDMIAFALFLEINSPIKPRKTHRQLLEQFKKK